MVDIRDEKNVVNTHSNSSNRTPNKSNSDDSGERPEKGKSFAERLRLVKTTRWVRFAIVSLMGLLAPKSMGAPCLSPAFRHLHYALHPLELVEIL